MRGGNRVDCIISGEPTPTLINIDFLIVFFYYGFDLNLPDETVDFRLKG